jgi:Bacterial protein of unknown function (DUF922)
MPGSGATPAATAGGVSLMGGNRSRLLGTDAAARAGSDDDDVLGGGASPGTLGVDVAEPMSAAKIGYVQKDWDRDNPEFTKPFVVSGKTIDQVLAALNRLPEWGEGGGRLELVFPRDFPGSGSVVLKAHLVHRMPEWREYDQARDVEQAAWTHMFRKLTDHEDRHVEIAIEQAEQLAGDLIGKTKGDAPAMVKAANDRMMVGQRRLDDQTNHGAKPDVPYGDVIMDLSRT